MENVSISITISGLEKDFIVGNISMACESMVNKYPEREKYYNTVLSLFRKLEPVLRSNEENPDGDLLKAALRRFTSGILNIEKNSAPNVIFPNWYSQRWTSDCFVLLGQLDHALEFYPLPPLGKRMSSATDCLLSLKLATGVHVSGIDLLTLLGTRVTAWGRNHLEQISQYMDILLDTKFHQNKECCLSEWAAKSHCYSYQVFIGTVYGYSLTKDVGLSAYSFSNCAEATDFVVALTREAENIVREESGIPHVGEGWISETQLYYEVKNAFPDLNVQQHASPEWLGRQHLDVYIPELRIALEFQGLQHDEPVEYFGGQKAYELTKKRDARKHRLCKKNSVRIIYVRPGYCISDLLKEIRR